MYSFSKESKLKLTQADQRLQTIAFDAIGIVDFTILETHRSQERQEQLYREGKSKVQVSKHNYIPSRAIDIAPYPIPKNWGEDNKLELARFYYLAGVWTALADKYNVMLRWGGDWNGNNIFTDQTFNDLVHFEILI